MKFLILSLATLFLQIPAFAAEDTSATDVPANTTVIDQNLKREDIDKEITNAKLRASTGAKSLISLQSYFHYDGGSVADPLSRNRPKLSPGTLQTDPAKLSGNISAKYRVSDHDNINLGTGVAWLTPFYQGQAGQVENPYISYGRTFKTGNFQNVFNAQFEKYTAVADLNRGSSYETDIAHTILTTLGKTKFQLGLVLEWNHEFYSRAVSNQLDGIALYPYLEYELSPVVAFRTVNRGLSYYSTTDAPTTFQQDDPTQSLGLGLTLTRDIYLYPNVQWSWVAINMAKTNVALAAYINL